ncbi:MAG: hypothetical protein NE328_13935 [Lentisphaeraceae bacterium]|nr:hypothetical protein [Lentisphaeraceae bacterium]
MSTKADNNPRHYLMNFGVLAVFCLLFMILFRVEDTPKGNTDEDSTHKLFQMIPDSATKNSNVLDQVAKDKLNIHEMSARVELDDPTIMSSPNRKYGFSTVRNVNDEPPKPAIEEYSLPVMNINAPLIARVPLVGIFPEPSVDDPGNFTAPTLSDIEIVKTEKEIQNRVVWIEDSLEKNSPVKIEDVQKAAAGKIPELRTEIKVEKLSSSPVLFLVQKCGIPELDSLVMNNLRSRMLKVFVGELDISRLPDSIIVDWRLVLRDNKSP